MGSPKKGCTNKRFCNKSASLSFQGLLCCEKALHYRFDWRYIYAMLIGYARVSTDDQDTAAQMAALKAVGCERIFREKASGGRWDRPQLQRLLDQLREGDVVVVWKLDRLSRALRDVLTIMEQLGEAGAGFRSLTEAIDTTTSAGRMMMQIVGAFAEFERAMLRERTKAGLDAARSSCCNSRPRFERWSPKATRQPPRLRACSRSIPLPPRGYWRETAERFRRRSTAPNSTQNLAPNNLQSDNFSHIVQ